MIKVMLPKDLKYYQSFEYNVIIKKEELDGEKWYVAYCNELGVNACHGIGATQEEALKSFIEEKNAFIEFLFENGDTIPEVIQTEQNLSGTFSVRTSPWIHASLVDASKKYGLSLNAYVNQLLSFGVGRELESIRCESMIHELGSRLENQHKTMLHSIQAISYKTNLVNDNEVSLGYKTNVYKLAV